MPRLPGPSRPSFLRGQTRTSRFATAARTWRPSEEMAAPGRLSMPGLDSDGGKPLVGAGAGRFAVLMVDEETEEAAIRMEKEFRPHRRGGGRRARGKRFVDGRRPRSASATRFRLRTHLGAGQRDEEGARRSGMAARSRAVPRNIPSIAGTPAWSGRTRRPARSLEWKASSSDPEPGRTIPASHPPWPCSARGGASIGVVEVRDRSRGNPTSSLRATLLYASVASNNASIRAQAFSACASS